MPVSPDSSSVIVLCADARTPVGLTHRLKLLLGPTGWSATPIADSFLAFAELCLHERAQASRAAWGLQRRDRTSLVVVDPLKWAGIGDLLAAVRHYAPSAAVWTYRDGQLQAVAAPRLQKLPTAEHDMTVLDVDEHDSDWTADVQTRPMTPVAPSRGLRLAGVDSDVATRSGTMLAPIELDAIDASPDDVPNKASDSAGRVTREEIDLLLQRDVRDSGDSARGAGGAG